MLARTKRYIKNVIHCVVHETYSYHGNTKYVTKQKNNKVTMVLKTEMSINIDYTVNK